jgi:nitrous-oxide reductase
MRIAVLALFFSAIVIAQEQAPNRREFKLVARDHVFIPNKIEVAQDDLVKITFTSEDRPASFAIDAYRIIKRAGGGQTTVFEFRADKPGTFPFYCNLTADEGCKDMKGTLVVKPR